MIAVAPCASSLPRLHLKASPEVAGESVRVSDLVDLSPLPASAREGAGNVVLFRLDGRAKTVTIGARAIAARLTGLAPALACSGLADANTPVVLRIRHDPVASHALLPARAEIRAGHELEVVTAVGPVQVRRRVTAVQPARSGQRLFVRARDGALISVRFEDVVQ